jgi:hypothetical protein
MSGAAGGAGGGGATNGAGGTGPGFVQSTNAFSGLTNTDLRPRPRRSPVRLVDSTWPIQPRGQRRRGHPHMRKHFSELVDGLFDTLGSSMTEIAASGVDDRDTLIKRSLGEFRAELFGQLEPVLVSEAVEEPLEKGLNHVACFANALRDLGRAVEAIKTGRPGWMVNDGTPPEEVSPDIADQLDRFVRVGVLTLQALVNQTAEEVDEPEELQRAEQMGELHKIECLDGYDILVKTTLPAEYRECLTDPVELLSDLVAVGREFLNQAMDIAEPLIKMDALPPEFIDEFPELFEQDGLGKAAGDEDMGAGDDPDVANDPGDGSDQTQDAPQDPLEMISRLASIIVVVTGSLMQAGQDEQDNPTGGDPSGMPDDTSAAAQAAPPQVPQQAPQQASQQQAPQQAPHAPPFPRKKPAMPLQRQDPGFDIGDVPLQKILRGEVEVHPTLADALEKMENDAALFKQTQDQLRLLQATVQRLQAQPLPPKGAVFAVTKSDDSVMRTGGGNRQEEETLRISELAKTNPDAAARELMKVVHSGGGTPLVPIAR